MTSEVLGHSLDSIAFGPEVMQNSMVGNTWYNKIAYLMLTRKQKWRESEERVC
jgi:hypothetical protein